MTQFAFDQFNRQISRTLPDGSTETVTFNDFGQLVQQIDFKGQKHTLQYDSLARLQLEQWFAAGSNTPGLTVSYAFDSLGRTSQVTDYRGTTSYVYNLDGQTTQIAMPEGTINYVYDPATGWHTKTITANTEIDYGNDEVGRLHTVTLVKLNGQNLSVPQVTTYSYNAVGLVASELRPDGSTVTNSYDVMNRLSELNDTVTGTTLLHDIYTRDADGRITGVQETQAQPTGGPITTTIGYQYDQIGRLIQEQQNSSLASSSFTASYSFDLVGNRLDYYKTAGSTVTHVHYTYNSRDELLTEATDVNGTPTSTTTHGYDLNGSEISGTTSGSDTTTYSWDLANRLAGAVIDRIVNGQSVHIETAYKYNPGGIRAQSDSTTWTNGVITEQQTNRLLIDSNNPTGYAQVLEELNAQGMFQAMTEYGLEPISQSRNGAQSFYHMDGHSGVRLLTSLEAAVMAAYGLEGYGQLIRSAGSLVNPVLYRGERLDPILGQYYLRARFYDPVIGRFTRIDPLLGTPSNPLTLQRYFYAKADPINYRDPTGNDWIDTAISIGVMAAIGAALGVFFNGLANYALGRPLMQNWWQAALSGAVLLPLSVLFPFVGIGVATWGIVNSYFMMMQVFDDPYSSTSQQTAALVLFGISVFGGWASGRYAGTRGFWRASLGRSAQGSSQPGPVNQIAASNFADLAEPQPTLRSVPRLAQDIDVEATPPAANNGAGYIGASVAQNVALARWLSLLRRIGADDIRVGQNQVNVNGVRVGINNPDLQFNYQGKHWCIEWDTTTSGRGIPHGNRILANDPDVQIILSTMD